MEIDSKDDKAELNKDYSDIEKNLDIHKYTKKLLYLIIALIIMLIAIIVFFIFIFTSKDSDEDKNKKNNYINIIKAKYYTNSTSLIKLINYDKTNIKLFVDGKEINFVNATQLTDHEEHLIEFKFNEELTNLSSLFSGCETLKEIDF